ncbi:MAG TPA: ABC transporter substrate-binding protein [Gaiellaceae bacterium]|nr:ABC transporter substrate-binding protein [Gaiellaceae bacterium]
MKARLRFLLVPAALAAVSLFVVAAATARTSASSSIIIDGTTDSVTNIDPAGNYDFGSGTVDYQIFNRLLEAGPGSLSPHPALAKSCGFKGNLKTYACTLRQGVKFSNGDSFTSTDVKWSFDRVIKINDPSGISSLLTNLKSVTVNGAYGVVFHLKNPQSTWPNILTTGAAQIVDHAVYPGDKILPNSSQHVGTGPYMLSTFTPGQQVVLKPNPNYWGSPKPANGGVIINYYSKSSTMKLALEKGDIDMAFQTFTPTELLSLQKEKGIKVHQGLAAVIRYLVMDVGDAATTTSSPTDELAVRQAVAYLFPRDTIAKRVYHGQVTPLYSMVPKGLPGHIDAFASKYGKKPNKAKAAAVLSAAGVSTPVDVTFWYTPSHYGDASADEFAEIQRALDASGLFKVTLKSAEWAQYVNTLGSTKGVFQLGWYPDYVDGENYLLPFYPKGQFLQNGYSNPKMDALMKKEQGTKSVEARLSVIKQAQRLAAQDVPIIPFWQGKMIAVSKNTVKGIDKTLDPTFILRFWLVSK